MGRRNGGREGGTEKRKEGKEGMEETGMNQRRSRPVLLGLGSNGTESSSSLVSSLKAATQS